MAVVAPALLTTAEVAAMFQVRAATVNRWVRQGVISALHVPGTKGYRFRVSDVERLLEDSESDTRADSEAVS